MLEKVGMLVILFYTVAYFDDDVDHFVDDKSEDPGQAQPTPYCPHYQGWDHQEETKSHLQGGMERARGREGERVRERKRYKKTISTRTNIIIQSGYLLERAESISLMAHTTITY